MSIEHAPQVMLDCSTCGSNAQLEKLPLQAVMDTSTDGVLAVDADGGVVATNRRFQELWGIPDELLATRDDRALLKYVTSQLTDPDGFRREVERLYASADESHDTVHFRDGRIFDRVSRPLAIAGRNGRLWSFRDQTTQRERDEFYRAIVNQAADAIVLIDCHSGRFVEFNDAACLQGGYTRDEFSQLNLADLTSMDAAAFGSTWTELEQRGASQFEVRHRCKDGSWRDIIANNKLVTLHGYRYIAAIWHDVTERKQALDTLRLSEERQRLAVNAGHIGLWDLDLVSGEARVNGIYAQMLGEDPATFHETNAAWLARLHPDDSTRVQESFRDYVEGRSPTYSLEFRMRTSDGSFRWTLTQGEIVERDATGKPLRMLGSHTDTDERKRLEERLQDSEFFLRESQQIGAYGGWRANTRENSVVWTDGIYSILGLPLSYWPDLATALDYYVPESRARVIQSLSHTLETGEPFSIEVQVVAYAGQLRWTELRGFPHHAASGEIDYVMGTLQDITARKRTDLELQDHRLRLEELVSERTAALEGANRRLSQNDARLSALFDLSQKASQLSESELLQLGINEAVRLTDSEIGYLHFVSDDQETLRLATWSDGTLRHCTAAHDDHYPVSRAGIWADTVRLATPVVHNDYASATGRKGYPPGHVHLVRHLGVPVIDGGKVCMLLGVGNKQVDYDAADVRELQLIGQDVWHIFRRRRTELQLAEAKETAEAANRAKSTFLANMSHEIRTPLNAITGFAHLVRQSGVTDEQALHLDQVDAAGEHLLEVINQVLDLAQIEAGRFVLNEARVDVPGVVANVMAMVQSAARRKGITLVSEVDALPPDCLSDPTRLRQALLNYATNAAKFTDSGRIVIRVRVDDQQAAAVKLRFEVEDTGMGIDPDTLARLFVDFEQADNSRTRQHRGTGLGLAITRRTAMLMGGEAGALSHPGAGSVFWFTAVLKRGAAVDEAASIPAHPSAKELLRTEFGGRRVLVVEDDPVNQMITSMLVRGAGLEVEIAGDGLEAIEKARAGDYAAILMDMQLPRLDGPTAARQIRATAGLGRVPIIAMTANAFAEDRAECLAAGMDDFITKPVSPAHLLSTLLLWLRRS
jgi:PAS domain S-box-containing protein